MKLKRARISDIAAKLECSPATVSRAITGKGYVRKDLAEKIRTIAAEMNYALPTSQLGNRVIVAASNDAMIDLQRSQFTTYVLEGLQEKAEVLGMEIAIHSFSGVKGFKQLDSIFHGPDVLGVLLLSVDDAVLDVARELTGPIVSINSDDPEMILNSVTPCNRSAAALATRHLVSLGHEDILFLTKPGRRTIERRLEGMRDIMAERFDPDLVVEVSDWTAQAAEAAIRNSLANGKKFTAVLASGDVLAAGAIMGLHSAGLDVPGDVSVLGIDGLPQGALLSPALTTVSIPMRAVGAVSLDLLLSTAKLRGTEHEVPASRIELACSLTIRESTGARI